MDEDYSPKQRTSDAEYLRSLTGQAGTARLQQIANRIDPPKPKSFGQYNYEAWLAALGLPNARPWSEIDPKTRNAWEKAAVVVGVKFSEAIEAEIERS